MFDELEQAEVVMIGNCYGIKAFLSTRRNEFLCVLVALSLGNCSCPLPIEVTGRMHLKITLVKMGTFINHGNHRHEKSAEAVRERQELRAGPIIFASN